MPAAARPLHEKQMEHLLLKFSVLFQTHQVLPQTQVVLVELPGPSSGTPLGQALLKHASVATEARDFCVKVQGQF